MNDLLMTYYTVGNKKFSDKVEAMVYANQTLADVNWYFNDDMFSKFDWTTEPSLSLDQLYKIRAQQIRDEYDYVILMFSGGADSVNIAKTFLNNGILVDEIVASAPISGLRDWKDNNTDISTENVISETKFSQLPFMNEFASKFPSIKLTLNDYFEDILNYKTDEWIYKSGEWIHPTAASRYSLEKFKHLRDLADSGKKIGVVYGIDKPSLIKNKGDLYLNLSDLAVNVPRQAFDRVYPNVENVLFYWSTNLPMLLVKQAHEVAKYMYRTENTDTLKYLADRENMLPVDRARMRQSNWERCIIPCIYPTTFSNVFQGHKSIRIFFAVHDQWFYNLHHKTTAYQMMDSDFRNFIKNINAKYLNANRTAFVMYNKLYRIGSISDFNKQLIV